MFPPATRHTLCFLLSCLLLTSTSRESSAQTQAFAGKPFGVARITVPLDSSMVSDAAQDDRMVVQEAQNRVFYPAIAVNPVRRVLRRFLQANSPNEATAFFLFTGDEPLEITFHSPNPRTLRIPVRQDERGSRRLLSAWWREYSAQARLTLRSDEYPPLLENYLTTTLARRLQLNLPPAQRRLVNRSQISEAVGVLLGAEAVRSAIQTETLTQNTAAGPANQPLPPSISLPEQLFPPLPDDGSIEPIAMHVPEECLYVRFGSFTNFLWLREFSDQWGGNLQNMIAVRGIDTLVNQRVEQQLSLHQSSLSKLLGPTVISDVAILASDTAFEDGPSVGILFEARNNFVLSTDLTRQRREAVSGPLAATEQTLTIAEHKVSLISTPDNRVRSFYAVDGDYHLVTTSRAIVERFFAAGAGKGSLGASMEFRTARSLTPASDDDLVFAYLSDAFFRRVLSPSYQIELMRRMRSSSEMQTYLMACAAAKSEGLALAEETQTDQRIRQLVAGGFLPAGFANRPDESQIVVEEGGRMLDSSRGARGSFIPVGDVPITAVSASEAAAYTRFASQYQADWRQVPTITAAIRKRTLNDTGLEQLSLNLRVTPVSAPKYARYLDSLGPPTKSRLAPVEGDMASAEIVLNMALPLWSGNREVHHVFGGLRDFRMPFVVNQGRVEAPGGRPMYVRGYLGAWPKVGLLELFVRNNPRQPDAEGYAELADGVGWQRAMAPMTVFSFKRDVLEEVTPQLRIVDDARPAQVRVQIADISTSELSHAINAFGYKLAHDTTTGGARFMNTMTRQLHTDPEDCRDLAEQLLNAQLVCALDADYELVEQAPGLRLWSSTALQEDNRFLLRQVPADYEFPLLKWFRGVETDLLFEDQTLSANATITIQQQDQQPKPRQKPLQPAQPKTEEIPAPKAEGFKLPKIPGFGG